MPQNPEQASWMSLLDVMRSEQRLGVIRQSALGVFAAMACAAYAAGVVPLSSFVVTVACVGVGFVFHLIAVRAADRRASSDLARYLAVTVYVSLISVVILGRVLTEGPLVGLLTSLHVAYIIVLAATAARFHVKAIVYGAALSIVQLAALSTFALIKMPHLSPEHSTLLGPMSVILRCVFIAFIAGLLVLLVRRAVEMQVSLQDIQKVHARMINQISDGFIVCSKDARIIDVNTAACELLSLPRSVLVELNAANALPAPIAAVLTDRWSEIEAEGFIAAQAIRLPIDDDTRIFDLVAHRVPFRDDFVVHVVLRDVSAQHAIKDQESQVDRLRALRAFAGEVTHEFNNILASVEASSFILAEAIPPSAPQFTEVQTIRNGTSRASDLVRTLADLTDSRQPSLEPIDPKCLFEKAIESVRHPARSAVQVIFDIDPQVRCILGDEDQLLRAISHLLVFSYDSMLDGGTLRISIKNSNLSSPDGSVPSRDWIRITIQDSGIGLPSSVAVSAFEAFPSSKAGRASLSLGLPNAHTVIARHGGSIQLRSAVGQGSTFLIRLPATSRRSEKPKALPSSRPALDRPMRLLVVDDEPANRTSLARLLSMRGYQVVLAEDGPTAIRECEQNDEPIDLVLLDLLMPGMNGRDVLLALRQRRPLIKVMVVTGFADPSLIEDAIHLGAIAVAHKPFNVPDLLDQVKKFTSSDFVPPQVS